LYSKAYGLGQACKRRTRGGLLDCLAVNSQECERASPFSRCEVGVDESYFGARRARGKRGRGATGRTTVFGIFKPDGCGYTEVVPDREGATPRAIIRGRVAPEAVTHSGGWRGDDGSVDAG
jgi:transposase-like protein